ncbi:MAG: hypothetical protein F4093_09330 [Gammaproteobacteria bacterium]|nr:hypothetical protein [Gammaproteobacteria bacterium]
MSGLSAHKRHDLKGTVRQVLLLQGIAASAVVLIVLAHAMLWMPQGVAGRLAAAIYGSLLAVGGTMLSARSVRRSSRVAATGSGAALVPIFSGLVLKLVAIGGGIGIGLVYFGLEAISLLTGFIVVQMSSVFSMPGRKTGWGVTSDSGPGSQTNDK